jgi:4-hydroxyphenylpyruvate dioxygenase
MRRSIRRLAEDLGLSIDLFQPFSDTEGVADDLSRRNLDRAVRKFDIIAELGAPMLLVCSNASQATTDTVKRVPQPSWLHRRATTRLLPISANTRAAACLQGSPAGCIRPPGRRKQRTRALC